MMEINSKPFITDNFLLNSKEAETLFHDFAKHMPVIDYHCHLPAGQMAENKPIGNITDAWLRGDHYKWRAMRANGIDEHYITGNASAEEKFFKWAETVPYTLRNPLFHWTQLELKRYFDINTILQARTAKEIYETANAVLASKTPMQLLEQMNVEVVCTTDDPVDNLDHHRQIARENYYTKVYPAFRSDNLFLIDRETFPTYLKKLESCAGFSIDSFTNLLQAIDDRIEFFHQNGCRLSDFGIGGVHTMVDFTFEEITAIFDKYRKGLALTSLEIDQYKSCLFIHLGRKYHEKGWVQQYHLGAIRDNNSRLQKQLGADAGCDSIGDYPMADFLSELLNRLDETNQLAKTITYNLNPAQNEVFAAMMGNFNGGVPGKMQYGSGWWYLDQKDGMEKQLNALSNIGLLSRFVGMLTDSRSFLSFPRHEYFRRILCNLVAEDLRQGLVPDDMASLGKMIQDICYHNAVNYFDFN